MKLTMHDLVKCITVFVYLILDCCLVTTACPRPCVCTLNEVVCKSDQQSRLPYGLPKSTKRFHVQFKSLEALDMRSMENLSNLEEVVIEYGRFEYVDSKTFGNLTNVWKLSITKTNLKTINDGSFSGLANLRTINLEENCIVEIHRNAFHSLLENINLKNNRLRSSFFLKNMQRLQSLDLSFNNLTFWDLNVSLNVRKLNLKQTQINPDLVLNIEQFSNLAWLDVSNNDFSATNRVKLKNSYTLDYLNISNCSLNGIVLQNLPSLKELYADGNKKLNVTVVSFHGLQNLAVLSLKDINLDDIGAIKNLLVAKDNFTSNNSQMTNPALLPTKLKTLDLRNNPLKCNCELKNFVNTYRFNNNGTLLGTCDFLLLKNVSISSSLTYRSICANEGRCSKRNGTFQCLCKSRQFYGEYCQLYDQCLCQHNGKCVRNATTQYCICTDGFRGKFCEKHSCIPNPCSNQEKCRIINNTIDCQKHGHDFVLSIVTVTCIAILLLLILSLLGWFRLRRRNRWLGGPHNKRGGDISSWMNIRLHSFRRNPKINHADELVAETDSKILFVLPPNIKRTNQQRRDQILLEDIE